jgi:hypothetical protein
MKNLCAGFEGAFMGYVDVSDTKRDLRAAS